MPINTINPINPKPKPKICIKVVFCLNQVIAIINANNGEVPFNIDNIPALKSCAA